MTHAERTTESALSTWLILLMATTTGPDGGLTGPRIRNNASSPSRSSSAIPAGEMLLTARVSASSQGAVALIVIEVFISPSGIWSNNRSMSPRWEIGTPTLPTSPRARI